MTPDPTPPRPANQIGRYAGLAFQMLAIIGVCTWLGTWLDRRLGLTTPWLTLGLTLFGVIGAMMQVIREVNRDVK